VSQGVLVVCAVRQTDGLLEILAVEVADTESEATYQEMFRLLKEVGFCRVQLVVSYDPTKASRQRWLATSREHLTRGA
jgi:transposase-like protein